MEEAVHIPPENPEISSETSTDSHFPKPDFTEITADYTNDSNNSNEKPDTPLIKPTFKNALQAKKRLQAFSSKPISPSSRKTKPIDEPKSDEGSPGPPKPARRPPVYHDDRARAVIEEIEEIKKREEAHLENFHQRFKHRTRSRSRSAERFRRQGGKKPRNYRKRSPTPENHRKSTPIKKAKKYPRNWREFIENEQSFELNKEFNISAAKGNNEILKQMRFELPSLSISPIKVKTVNLKEKIVSFENIRYTRSKPIVSYNENCTVVKQRFLNKKIVMDLLPKEHTDNMEKLYSSSFQFRMDEDLKTRLWYKQTWEHPEIDYQVYEKSVGLSFLQNYIEETEELETEKPAEKQPEDTLPEKPKQIEKEKKKKRKDKAKVKDAEAKKKKKKKSKKREKRNKKKKNSHHKEKTKTLNSSSSGKEDAAKVKQETISVPTHSAEKSERKRKISETEESAKKIKIDKSRMKSDKQKSKSKKLRKQNEEEKTPDTDDYHSHWESDDEGPTIVRPTLKPNRSWESDEELFDRTYQTSKAIKTESYQDLSLEIPLNIKSNFPRRSAISPLQFDTLSELKRLEIERQNLYEERKKLEAEKEKILKLQEEQEKRNKAVEIEPKIAETEKPDPGIQTNSNSNTPAVLENEYEEFIKAVSNENATPKKKPSKKKSSSSSDSESNTSDSDHKRKKRKKKNRKRKKIDGLLPGRENQFNEFDIPEKPADLPEALPPMPVPSPIVIPALIPAIINNIPPPPPEEPPKPETPEPIATKPFVFPSITLTKKILLKKDTKVKLNDDEEEDNAPKKAPLPAPTPPPPSHKTVKNDEKPKKAEVVKKRAAKKSRSRSRSRSKSRKQRASPLPKRRFSSPPRRRSPVRRRSSPPRRFRRSRRSRSPRPRKRTPTPERARIHPRSSRVSPLNSPLDGFKRSVADSTISDDMLPQPSGLTDSPMTLGTGSPKRISLDDRINQVLGLEKHEEMKGMHGYPPPNNYDFYNYGGQYGRTSGNYAPPPLPPPPFPPSTSKVVQVGNILQVVPTDDLLPTKNEPIKAPTLATNQKYLQVGNMLQIVPSTILPTVVVDPVMPTQAAVDVVVVEKETKRLERKLEREKRHLERDRRRKDKERKRKEREKRKQMKVKQRTELMIKKALQFDESSTGEMAAPSVIVSNAAISTKSILLIGGAKMRKNVQFADGIRPGEGTSPSGGEELSSPPPNPRHLARKRPLPKEKRCKKSGKVGRGKEKAKVKRKVKVRVIKKQQNVEENAEDNEEEREDDEIVNAIDDEYENLPPPSPPPGSPPPHIFPPRVKSHTINNIHPVVAQYGVVNSVPGYGYRPPMGPPMVLNRPGGVPPPPPPHGYLPGAYHPDLNNLTHPPSYQGVNARH